MGKATHKEGMSLNYRINGEVNSFRSADKFLSCIKSVVVDQKELLKVEPLDDRCCDYDHMQEIMDLSFKAIPCIKGLQAMASRIQNEGNFNEYDPTDMMENMETHFASQVSCRYPGYRPSTLYMNR